MFKKEDFISLSSLVEIQKLNAEDFEWFCKFFLEALEYRNVSVTSYSYDGGIDGYFYKNEEKIAFQAKHWSKYGDTEHSKVGAEVVRALYGSMELKNIKQGLIIATVPAYKIALKNAEDLNIKIIDLEKLKELMLKLKPYFDKKEQKPSIFMRICWNFNLTKKEGKVFIYSFALLISGFFIYAIRDLFRLFS